MYVTVKCPSCGGSASIPEDYIDRRIRCSRCKEVIKPRQLLGEARATEAIAGLETPVQAPAEDSASRPSAPEAGTAQSTPSQSADIKGRAEPPLGSAAEPAQSSSADVSLAAQFGRYRIIRKLGQGGMGAVYLAHDTQLDRPVALKIPHFTSADGQDVLERFGREAKAAATLTHPNLCPVYDVGEANGRHFLTMAYIEGRPLSNYLRAGEQLPERQVAALIRKLALALGEAHAKGVVHRDLKPSNIMINQRKEPVVMDFGLARRIEKGDARLTKSGAVLGTPAYMSPEQLAGAADAVGPACDVYSLGVIMYELLTGRLPFEGPAVSVLAQILMTQPERPSVHRPKLDPELEAICLKAMAKKVEDRYATMGPLASALADFLWNGGLPSVAQETGSAFGQQPVGTREQDSGGSSLVAQLFTDLAPSRGPLRAQRGGTATRPGRRLPPWPWVAAGGAAVALVLGIAIFTRPKPARMNEGKEDGPLEEALRAQPEAESPKPAPSWPSPPATSDTPPDIIRLKQMHQPGTYVLRFDGRTNRIRIPKSAFKYYGKHSLTIEAIVTPEEGRSLRHVVCDLAGDSGFFLGLWPGNRWAFGIHEDENTRTRLINNAPAVLRRRVHLAAVVDHPKRELRLFVDGKLNDAVAHRDRPLRASEWDIIIGADPDHPQPQTFKNFFSGLMEQVSFSKVARYATDFEPRQILGADKDTLILYHFNEGEGFTAYDSSGKDRHAQIEGAQWVKVSK